VAILGGGGRRMPARPRLLRRLRLLAMTACSRLFPELRIQDTSSEMAKSPEFPSALWSGDAPAPRGKRAGHPLAPQWQPAAPLPR